MSSPYQAASWWLDLWATVMVGLIAVAFLIPFQWWVIAAFVLFGTMEGIGLWANHGGKYPPLTDVIRTFVPSWACLAAMWGLLAAAGSVWGVVWTDPLSVALWFAVVGWLTTHFLDRYNQPASD